VITTFIVLVAAVAAVWYFVDKNKKTLDVNKDGKLDANDVKLAAERLDAEYAPKVAAVVEEVKAEVKKVEETFVADVKKVEEKVKKVAAKTKKAAAPKAKK
jgi:hypothetical protein